MNKLWARARVPLTVQIGGRFARQIMCFVGQKHERWQACGLDE